MSGTEDFCTKLDFDTKVYPVEAIMGTAYKYLDQVYTRLESANGDNTITATLKAKKVYDSNEWERFAEEFAEEVLSQSLRIKILKLTKKVRDQIITIALTYTPYSKPIDTANADQCDCGAAGGKRENEMEIDRELDLILTELKKNIDNDDYEADPLDIAVPWEEKYESNKDEGTGNE